MNKKLVFGMSALILLAGIGGFQINDKNITFEKVKGLVVSDQDIPDLQTFEEVQIYDSLFDAENMRYLIYENCSIEANQSHRIDRENFNVYDEENNTLCLIKEMRNAD